MKKKIFGFLTAVLTLGILGGTAFVAADNGLQKEEAAIAANMTGGELLYLNATSWGYSDARYATYFFNNSTGKNTWVNMTKCANNSGYYKVTAPSGTWANLIFVRMNGTTTANNWNNKWNQTGNLTYNTTKNCFKPNGWDGSTSTWSSFSETNSMSLDVKTHSFEINDTLTVTATYNFGADNLVNWTTNDASVISLGNTTGKTCTITALSSGTATLTATIEKGSNATASYAKATASCTITVLSPEPSVELDSKTLFTYIGNNVSLSATKHHTDESIVWSVGDDSIVSISETDNSNIVINGLAHGSTTITATIGEVSQTCEVSVATPGYLYFTPHSTWAVDNARFAAYFFGNGDTWVDLALVEGETDVYQVKVPTGFSSVIFVRMNPNVTENNWTNSWGGQTVDLTIDYDGNGNHYTYTDGAVFTKGSGTWSDYLSASSPKKVEYKFTYKDPSTNEVIGSQNLEEDSTWNSYFVEKEGYRLEGWYTDAQLTNEFVKGAKVTSDLTLYAKYVEADDYRILINEYWFNASDEAKHSMSVYLWRDALDGGNNAWPGEKVNLSVKFDNYYILEIDASKSFDKIIVNNDLLQDDPKQTIDVELSTDDLAVYNIGDLDKDKFNISCDGVNEISFAYKIYELAGDFVDNGDEITEQCAYKYQTAKEMFLNLSDDDKTDFQGFNSGDLLAARTTYEHWCQVNNDNTPYEGPVVSESNIAINFAQDNSAYLLIILLFVGLSMTGFIVIKRKRKAN